MKIPHSLKKSFCAELKGAWSTVALGSLRGRGGQQEGTFEVWKKRTSSFRNHVSDVREAHTPWTLHFLLLDGWQG